MNIIKLNNVEFEIENYTRNTNFSGDTMTSNGYCSLINADVDDITALAQTTITSIQILHNNNIIYNITDITARIESISESFSGGERMYISMNFIFE